MKTSAARVAASSALSICALLFAPGCILQGGLHVGRAIRPDADDQVTWGGQAAAALLVNDTWHVGLEADGRAEHRHGSALSTGLQLGYYTGTDRSNVRFGGHADIGVPLAWSSEASWYAGGALELPLRLTDDSPSAERNRTYRIAGSVPWLVPFLRYRFHDERHEIEDAHDIVGGLMVRLSYSSDLF